MSLTPEHLEQIAAVVRSASQLSGALITQMEVAGHTIFLDAPRDGTTKYTIRGITDKKPGSTNTRGISP